MPELPPGRGRRPGPAEGEEGEEVPSEFSEQQTKEALRRFAPNDPDPLSVRRFISMAIRFPGTFDYMLAKILSQPLEAETSHYELPQFYSVINLGYIRDVL